MYLRDVRAEDIPEICKLPKTREELFYCFPRAAFPLAGDEVRQGIENRSDSTVIEIAGKVVAFANFYRWKDGLCSIGNVVVASDARGLGVGRYLINHMIRLGFEKHHAEAVSVSCFNRNAAGLLFYPKFGFRPYDIEQRIDYNGDRVALIHLRVENHAL
ncbi:GNAT family protein [Marinobacterium maritimum]|uniref:GNAT family protein n=1 Tax=Marinobacterium maritimum TaxID=500162 RepID=A0ABN1I236_9GAMM